MSEHTHLKQWNQFSALRGIKKSKQFNILLLIRGYDVTLGTLGKLQVSTHPSKVGKCEENSSFDESLCTCK